MRVALWCARRRCIQLGKPCSAVVARRRCGQLGNARCAVVRSAAVRSVRLAWQYVQRCGMIDGGCVHLCHASGAVPTRAPSPTPDLAKVHGEVYADIGHLLARQPRQRREDGGSHVCVEWGGGTE
eukprot:gene20604-biopygen4096